LSWFPIGSGPKAYWFHKSFVPKIMFHEKRSKVQNEWKFHNFSLTQIIREINFWDSRNAKSDILTYLQVLIFMNFCIFWRLEFTKSTKIRAPEIAKTAVLLLLDSPKLISRKIWMTEKTWNFHTVWPLPDVYNVGLFWVNDCARSIIEGLKFQRPFETWIPTRKQSYQMLQLS